MRRITAVDDLKQTIISSYELGTSSVEIGIRLGFHRQTICSRLKEWKVPRRSTKQAARKYSLNHDYFETVNTEDKAYFLGLLYADGCVSIRNSNYELIISLVESDKHILDELKKRMGSDIPLYYIDYRRTGKHSAVVSNAYRLDITSKKLILDLVDKGMVPRKTKVIRFPYWLCDDLRSHFLRGFLDGDGCIYTYSGKEFRKTTVIFVSADGFCRDIKSLLGERGIRSSIIPKRNGISEVRVCGIRQSLPLLDYLYQGSDPSLRLGRKHDKYLEVKSFAEEKRY